MAGVELQLVCKIIKTGEIKRAIEWGITEDDFFTTEPKTMFKLILATYLSHDTAGSVIGPQLATDMFPLLNLNEVDTSVTIEHLCLEVRKRRLAKDIREGAQKAIDEAELDPVAAINSLQMTASNAMRLDAGRMTDVEWVTGMEQIEEDYYKVKRGEIVGKFIWPWQPLQVETCGGQEDDYVVFYGRPKSMKSWVLCYIIAFLVSFGNSRVLVYTKEMTTKNIYKRIAACLAGIPYDNLRKGTLEPYQEAELRRWVLVAKSLAGTNQLIVLSAKDVAGRDTVSWLKTKAEKYSPDVIVIDGLYLMSPENPKITKTNERVESISRAMRALILDLKTPVIATMQANRKAAQHENAEFDEIAFSDSLSQDCTMAVRVIKNKTEPTISLVFAGAREIKFAGLSIKAMPCTNFDFHALLSDKEVQQAKKEDEAEEEGKETRNSKKREPKANMRQSEAQKAYQKGMAAV